MTVTIYSSDLPLMKCSVYGAWNSNHSGERDSSASAQDHKQRRAHKTPFKYEGVLVEHSVGPINIVLKHSPENVLRLTDKKVQRPFSHS